MDARNFDTQPALGGAIEKSSIDLHRHIALFRRRLRLFLSIGILVFVATVVVTFQLSPRYTAVSEVILDQRHQTVTNVQEVLSGLPDDTSVVDTQVEVIKSRSLADKVATALNLDRDAEFNLRLRKKSFLRSLLPQRPPPPDSPLELQKQHSAVVDQLLQRLKVSRSGLTEVIKISFESESPEKAAIVADAFADHYLLEQLDAKFDATRRASDWLNDRLKGLKVQVEQAEAAVAQYKASHGLLGLGTAEGATIAQQEVSNINTQLAAAKAQYAEAEANLNTARQQLARGSNGDDLGAALNSPVINTLRGQRSALSNQLADMAGRLGPRHPDMLKAQRQLADTDAEIQAEIKRVTSNLEAQAEVARQRVSSIAGSLSTSRGTLASNGSASVQLNDLQRNADSLSTLYQTYLDRFKQTSNQQGLEQSDARVVSRAKIPTMPSFPNIPLNLALGAVLAMAAAIGTMFLVDALESGLYTSEDVEKLVGVPHLGSIPMVETTLDRSTDKARFGKKNAVSPMRFVIERPLSSFAESFRSLKTSVLFSKIGEPVKVIAVTSSLPGEGKTTTCVCLGRVIAMGGSETVIVDCDLRRRTVNRLFEEAPTVGLLEVLSGTCSLQDALIRDEESGAWFLPLSKNDYTPKDVFSSAAMDRLLLELKARFDVVLLDTAPILPVADTRSLAPKADVTMFLAQWRKTPRKAVDNAIKQLEAVGADVVGVCLTQVDMKEQARSGYGDASYYYRSYKQYYA